MKSNPLGINIIFPSGDLPYCDIQRIIRYVTLSAELRYRFLNVKNYEPSQRNPLPS